uniref:Ig-like domain-containing protein n=1 Tax=Astyanax mexicanus TaxID=7994 RepID=A0A8B9GP31_ASTMX
FTMPYNCLCVRKNRPLLNHNFKVVGPDAPLVVEVDEDLVLPCSLHPNISAVDMTVEWERTDLYQTDNLVHVFKDFGDINDNQRQSYRGRTALFKEELLRGNTSLKLSAVQPSDEGVYKCIVCCLDVSCIYSMDFTR